jgi:Ca2+-binding EF-hand superfamily protein
LSHQEIEIVWKSLDYDHSGGIEYKEFVRKLERFGVRNRSKEEIIIYQMVEAM